MKVSRSGTLASAAVAMLLTSGCATVPQPEVDKRATDIKVYSMDQFVPGRYDVVSRIWWDSWRSALVIPTHPTRDDAMMALRVEAARLGADGLVNVNCRDRVPHLWLDNPNPPPILCFGVAVRFRPNQG